MTKIGFSGSLAAVELPAILTLPIFGVLLLIGGWYWIRLGRGLVLPIRRRLRRTGLLIASVTASFALAAVSFIDPEVMPIAYLLAWTAVLILVFAAVLVALADVAVTVRVHQKSSERRMLRDARAIRRAMEAEEPRKSA